MSVIAMLVHGFQPSSHPALDEPYAPSHHGKVKTITITRCSVQIGEASRLSGVSSKMIRHYESIGLIPDADRRDSNYRDYGPDDVHRLGFVRRARDLGFSIDEIRQLLRLWTDRRRSSRSVKALTLRHIADLDAKIAQLEEMRSALAHLASCCEGGDRPDCPILDSLAGALPPPSHHHQH
jgi:Cu(I)-responsive transcriptional regulator